MKNIKSNLLKLIISDIENQITTAEKGRKDAFEESKVHKGAMESRYDTFKEEAQYLAGGFDTRVQELQSLLATLKSLPKSSLLATNKVMIGSIVEVEYADDNTRTKYFLLPVGGGKTYKVNDEEYAVLTFRTPLAKAIMGKAEGEKAEISIRKTKRRLLIVSVT